MLLDTVPTVVAGFVTDDHDVPFQCRITPLVPTAQTSLALLPQIALGSEDPFHTLDHEVPFHSKIVPKPPL
jgi:hypothetical protein